MVGLTPVNEAIVPTDAVGCAVVNSSELSGPKEVLNPVDRVVRPVIIAPSGVYVNNDDESATIDTLPNCSEAIEPVKLSVIAPGVTMVEDGPEILRTPPVAVQFTAVVLPMSQA